MGCDDLAYSAFVSADDVGGGVGVSRDVDHDGHCFCLVSCQLLNTAPPLLTE